MSRTILATAAVAALAGAGAAMLLSARPVTAQQFGSLAPSSIAATAPNAAGVSHAWLVDPRTNRIVFCRGDAAGKISCTEGLMPGAARTPG